jgi:hypothetical protein
MASEEKSRVNPDSYKPVDWRIFLEKYVNALSGPSGRGKSGDVLDIALQFKDMITEMRQSSVHSSSSVSNEERARVDADREAERKGILQKAEQFARQEAAELDKLEVFPLETRQIPSVVSVNQKDLAARVEHDFKTYGMVLVASELGEKGSEKEVRRLVDLEQSQVEIESLDQHLANYREQLQAGLITQEYFEQIEDGIEEDKKEILKNGSSYKEYKTAHFIQVVPGKPPQDLSIYYKPAVWNIQSIIPRGFYKSSTEVNAARTAQSRQLPLEGTIWGRREFEARENSKYQPSVILSALPRL